MAINLSNPDTQLAGAVASWRDRAVGEWRKQGMTMRLRALLGDDVQLPEPELGAGLSSLALDGVVFRLKSDDTSLEVDAPCPRCHKAQQHGPIETLSDLGRALDSLCRDCDFLARAGISNGCKRA